jgi:cytochrome b6-f complex iron-sulfur subunit
MPTLPIVLLATAAGLLALAFWWIRRTNLAVPPVGTAPRELRPLPAGCDVGRQLLMATTAETASAESGAVSRGAPGQTATPRKPSRKKRSGPTRRAFLRGAMGIGWLGVLSGFGGATLAFLWPDLRGGFGGQIEVDTEDSILDFIRSNREPYVFAPGRLYIVEYDQAMDPDGQYAEITAGSSVMALYHRCVHLGCRVPWCQSSQWFECPCHGSRYNRWGEFRGGPAPRGLDRFPLTIDNGNVVVNTGEVITGPARQAAVLDQPPEGPSCL